MFNNFDMPLQEYEKPIQLCNSASSDYSIKDLFPPYTSSEVGTYRLCKQRRFRRACVSEQSRQNLRCSLIQAVSQEDLQTENQIPGPSEWLGMRS